MNAQIHENIAAKRAIDGAWCYLLYHTDNRDDDLECTVLAALMTAVELQAEKLGLGYRVRIEGGNDD